MPGIETSRPVSHRFSSQTSATLGLAPADVLPVGNELLPAVTLAIPTSVGVRLAHVGRATYNLNALKLLSCQVNQSHNFPIAFPDNEEIIHVPESYVPTSRLNNALQESGGAH